MTLLTHDRYCAEIDRQVGQLRDIVTSGTDLAATVPTCPDWSLEKLVRHTGGALRWVTAIVENRAQENVPHEQVPGGGGPRERGDAKALDAWLAQTGERVVAALREAGPDTEVWSWSANHDTAFWARRMTHEITVHRADAALTAGVPYEVAPEIAADTVDEWLELMEWAQRTGALAQAKELRGPGRTIHLHPTDAAPELNAEWIIELGEEGFGWRRGHEKATVALRGPLTSVLLAFYRRLPPEAPGLDVLGEREVLDFWLERSSFG